MIGKPKLTGWAKPIKARKLHYFRNGKSKCGKWSDEGMNIFDFLLHEEDGDECKKCRDEVNSGSA